MRFYRGQNRYDGGIDLYATPGPGVSVPRVTGCLPPFLLEVCRLRQEPSCFLPPNSYSGSRCGICPLRAAELAQVNGIPVNEKSPPPQSKAG